MFEHFKIETKGKRAVVIGRSNIVGRPMSILLSSDHPQGNCTVTCCHRYTPKEDLIEICSKADILVVAVGMPDFIDASMIKPGAVIIDVGITRVTDATAAKGFRIKGDVNYASAITVASAVTPVPGGVGSNDHRRIIKKYNESLPRFINHLNKYIEQPISLIQ
jgi:methylenetetrahydrofolate dehydrogenase (NADP+) / methenyltetrahydrofolate cyclohydrolase